MPTDLPTAAPDERRLQRPGALELDPAAGDLATDETPRLIAAGKVAGTAVYDRGGERLGTIDAVMIDKTLGHVAYAVLSSGGFLGIGDSLRPIPWKALTYSVELGGYVVDDAPPAAEGAPSEPTGPLPAA